MKSTIVDRKVDFFLSVFPIWVPIIYFFFLISFPNFENLIFILTMLILGETHFGITWLIFADKKNIKWALDNKKYSIFYPILLIVFIVIGYFFISKNITLFLVLLFNFYHVTRQSEGIAKIYCYGNKNDTFISKLIIYIFSLYFIFYSLEVFIFKTSFVFSILSYQTILIILISVFILWYFVNFFKNSSKDIFLLFSSLTGALMFFPFMITDKMIHAFGMGVGMHYCQYILFSFTILSRRSNVRSINSKSLLVMTIIFILFIYSSIMIIFSNIDKQLNINSLSFLIIIPIILQTLHFYADMFIWKFSYNHQRNNILKFLVK